MEITKRKVPILLTLFISSCGFIHEKVDTIAEDGTRIMYTKEFGLKEGLYQHFHKNGQVRFEVEFVGGNAEGEGRYYDSLGRLEMVEVFKEDTVIWSTEYHDNGNIEVVAGRQGELRNGPLFQMTENGDTIATAYFELDSTRYFKAYDMHDGELLEYFLDYRLGFLNLETDSILIKLAHRSPDPKLEWKFALGAFSDEEIDNYDYEDSFVSLSMEAYYLGSFIMHRSKLVDGRVKGLIVEYDGDYIFHTPVDEKIE